MKERDKERKRDVCLAKGTTRFFAVDVGVDGVQLFPSASSISFSFFLIVIRTS